MVVAGAQMGVAFELAFFTAHNQHHFGVDFVAEHAIHHVRAHGFELACPVDVVFFVKARHQFHHHGNLFTGRGGGHQRGHQIGIAAGAVDGHFNRHHVRIARGLLNQAHGGLERLIGVVQQHVLLAHHVQQRAVFAQQLRGAGAVRGEFEVGAIHHIGHGHQPHQVNRALYAVKLGAAELELAKQKVIHMLGAVIRHFQAHGAAVLAVAQLAHNGGAQVFNVFFVYAQIAVAGEAELVAAFDGHAGKQGVYMGM